MPEDKVSKKIETGVIEKPEIMPGPEAEGVLEQAAVEHKAETAPEAAEQPAERVGEAVSAAPVAPVQKTPDKLREEQIDKILSEDLEEAFLSLPAKKQAEFQAEGEVTVKKINELLHKAKVSLKKIIGLIKKWLALIPGINKFFLEQEAKIKADKILKLKK